MCCEFDDVLGSGESFSILWVLEELIYGCFGYGVVMFKVVISADCDRIVFRGELELGWRGMV